MAVHGAEVEQEARAEHARERDPEADAELEELRRRERPDEGVEEVCDEDSARRVSAPGEGGGAGTHMMK